jgi:hypothetical protein
MYGIRGKCENCGDLLDFGGRNPDTKMGPETKLPDEAIEFDGSVYCQECVNELIQFGAGNITSRIDHIEDRLREALEALGMRFETEE